MDLEFSCTGSRAHGTLVVNLCKLKKLEGQKTFSPIILLNESIFWKG